jgi:hypothetical protein
LAEPPAGARISAQIPKRSSGDVIAAGSQRDRDEIG